MVAGHGHRGTRTRVNLCLPLSVGGGLDTPDSSGYNSRVSAGRGVLKALQPVFERASVQTHRVRSSFAIMKTGATRVNPLELKKHQVSPPSRAAAEICCHIGPVMNAGEQTHFLSS